MLRSHRFPMRHARLVALALLLSFSLPAGVALAQGDGSGGGGGGGGGQAFRSIAIGTADRSLRQVSVAELLRLPRVGVRTPQSGGKQVQRGPRVRAVLAHVGIRSFTRLRVTGSDGTLTFTSRQIGRNVVLDVTRMGGLKLAGTNLPASRWVRNVRTIVAVR